MQINVSFDQSVGSLPAGFVAAVDYVVNYFDTLFTSPVTINIAVGYGEIDGQSLGANALGESYPGLNSQPGYVLVESYAQVRAALLAENAPGASTLPTSSPLSGSVLVTEAEAKALGLYSNNSGLDGWVGFSSAPNTFSYTVGAAPPSNEYYFVGVVEHEFTEVMGRVSSLDQAGYYSPIDLYRYAGSGVRQTGTGAASYFSINGGATDLDNWNNFQTGNNGDLADWAPSAGYDAFDDNSYPGVVNQLSAVDLTLMRALGWSTSTNGIVVSATASDALQGGPAVLLLSGAPTITDQASATLASATVEIANGSGTAVVGDELFINGAQSGTVDGGVVTASWNNSTKVLTLTGVASLAVYQTLLSEVSYQDTGTDSSTGGHPVRTVTWTVNDGTNNLSTTSSIAVDRAPVAVNDVGTDVVGTTLTVNAAAGVLANDTDPDDDSLSVSGVSDTANGAGTVGQPLAGVYGHLTLNANGSYTYVADITSAINGAPTGSHLHDIFSYTASDGNGMTATATLNITLDRPPVLTAGNVTATTSGEVFSATSLFSASDPDGNPITEYVLYDWTAGGGHWVVNGVVEPAATDISITAAQLSQTTFQSATSGGDLLGIAAYDGVSWSAAGVWTKFDVNAPAEQPPVVAASNVTAATPGEVFSASSLFSAGASTGYSITEYELYDFTTGSGHWVVNGVIESAATDISITAAQLSQTTFQSATTGGDLLGVAAYDGVNWSNSGAWTKFDVNAPIEPPPVVAAVNVTATTSGEVFSASSLFSASDPSGNPIVEYELYDWTTGGGHWVVNGVVEPAATDISITAAQLSQTTFQSATSGGDMLGVAAYDGINWSNSGAWTKFDVNAPVEQPPVLTTSNVTATTLGEVFSASSLFSASDPSGNPIIEYELYDFTTGSGHWVVNGVVEPAATDISITAAQLSQTTFQSATSGGDLLGVAAYDGVNWSNSGAWTKFDVNAPASATSGAALNATSIEQFAFSGDPGQGASSATDSKGWNEPNLPRLGHYMSSTFVTPIDGSSAHTIDASRTFANDHEYLTHPHHT